CAKELGAMDYW
nr:immunoglobulin heavy chain junction region [Mus musculus]